MPSWLDAAGSLIREEPKALKVHAGTLELHTVAQFCKQHRFSCAQDFRCFLAERKAALVESRLGLECCLEDVVTKHRRQLEFAVLKLKLDANVFKDPAAVLGKLAVPLDDYLAELDRIILLDVLNGLGQSNDDFDAIIKENENALSCVINGELDRTVLTQHCLECRKTLREVIDEGRCIAEKKLTGGYLFEDFFRKHGDLIGLFIQSADHRDVLRFCKENHCTLLEIVERGQRQVQNELGIKDYSEFPNLLYAHEDLLSLAENELRMLPGTAKSSALSFLAHVREYDCETFKDFLHLIETTLCKQLGGSTPAETSQLVQQNNCFIQRLFGKPNPSISEVYRKVKELGERSLAGVIVSARVKCLQALLGVGSDQKDLRLLESQYEESLRANEEMIRLSQIQTGDIFQLQQEIDMPLLEFCQEQEARLLSFLLEEESYDAEYLEQQWKDCADEMHFVKKAIAALSEKKSLAIAQAAALFFKQHRTTLSGFCEVQRERTIAALGFNSIEKLTLFLKLAGTILARLDGVRGFPSIDYQDDITDAQLDALWLRYPSGLLKAVLAHADSIIAPLVKTTEKQLWKILLNTIGRTPIQINSMKPDETILDLELTPYGKIDLATCLITAADVYETSTAQLIGRLEQLHQFFQFVERECALVDGLEADAFSIQERVALIMDAADLDFSSKLADNIGVSPSIALEGDEMLVPNIPNSIVQQVLQLASLTRRVRETMQVDKTWLQMQSVLRDYMGDPLAAPFVAKKLTKDEKERNAK